MWSELGSVIYTEPPGCTAVSCIVYISCGSDSASLLSQGELVELADSSLSQRRALTGGGEHPDHHQGAVQVGIKIKTHSPPLNQ